MWPLVAFPLNHSFWIYFLLIYIFSIIICYLEEKKNSLSKISLLRLMLLLFMDAGGTKGTLSWQEVDFYFFQTRKQTEGC